MIGRLRARCEADGDRADRRRQLGEHRGQLVVTLDRDRCPVQRGDRPVDVRERDQRMEGPRLRPRRHRRIQRLRPEKPAGVDHRLPPVQPELPGDLCDRVVRHGEDDQLHLVHQGIRLGERAGTRDVLAEAFASPGIAGGDRDHRPACAREGRAQGRAHRSGADDPHRRSLAGLAVDVRVGMIVRVVLVAVLVVTRRGGIEIDAMCRQLRGRLGALLRPALGQLASERLAIVPGSHRRRDRGPAGTLAVRLRDSAALSTDAAPEYDAIERVYRPTVLASGDGPDAATAQPRRVESEDQRGQSSRPLRRSCVAGCRAARCLSVERPSAAGVAPGLDLARTPVTVKILLENVLRHAGRGIVRAEDVTALGAWTPGGAGEAEIPFLPSRVILQDFTGVPAVVDLAVMRDAMAELGGDPARVNPLVPADLVIDHSVQVDQWGGPQAFAFNVEREYERNGERYQLLRWAQTAFRDLRVVPPGTGIVHQVNLEFLAQVVDDRADAGGRIAFPDTLVGTDSHTTMINALGVLGYGVGGIEAEAVLLGQPLYQPMPRVVGVRLTGALPQGATATDLVLVVTELLRAYGVVGAFVEFAGDGLAGLSLADRATISNMSPEFGATSTLFPIDDETLAYLRLTGRTPARVDLVERYAKTQGLWREPGAGPTFDAAIELDLATVEPSLAGPRRPQDRVGRRGPRGELPDGVSEHRPEFRGCDGRWRGSRPTARAERDARERRGRGRRRAARPRASATARSSSRRSRRARTPPTRR